MRISDWSSDGCSSDLTRPRNPSIARRESGFKESLTNLSKPQCCRPNGLSETADSKRLLSTDQPACGHFLPIGLSFELSYETGLASFLPTHSATGTLTAFPPSFHL